MKRHKDSSLGQAILSDGLSGVPYPPPLPVDGSSRFRGRA